MAHLASAFLGLFQGLMTAARDVPFERNKIMKLVNSIFAACVTVIGFTAFANPLSDGKNYTEKVGDYTWTFSVENGEATIVHLGQNYDGSYYEDGQRAVEPQPQGELAIPATLGGCPVVGLGYRAVADSDLMTSVTMSHSVKNIGNYAFSSCNALRNIELSNGVTNIGYYAFGECPFSTIDLPSGLASIAGSCFANCYDLEQLLIPASVRSIGDCAFQYCSELRDLIVDADNQFYESDNGALYDKSKETILFWPKQKPIVIPDGVRDIRPYVFYGNFASQGQLLSLALPSSVTNVGQCAFQYCYLNEITLNEGLVSIDDGAFQDNHELRAIVIPSTVKRMGNTVFGWCSNLSAVFFEGNAPEELGFFLYDVTPDGLTTFVRPGSTGWRAQDDAELPDTWPPRDQWGNGSPRAIHEWTTYPDICWLVRFDIGEGAIRSGGGDLEQVVKDGQAAIAPELATKSNYEFVGWDKPFSCVSNLMEIAAIYKKDGKLMDGKNYTEKVGGYTWTFSVVGGEATIIHYGQSNYDGSYYEDGLNAVAPKPQGELDIPAFLGGCPVIGVGYRALYDCDALTSVKFAASVRNVGSAVCSSCDALQSIELSSGVTNIGCEAFSSCAVSGIDLPQGLVSVEERAFAYCLSLEQVQIPASVKMIGDGVFYSCSRLRVLVVDADNACYSSEDGVLYDKSKESIFFWPRPKAIEIPSGVRDIRSYAFSENYASRDSVITLPSSVTNIGQYAFRICGLKGIVLNEGLVSIGYGAFEYNYELRSIVIPSTVQKIADYVLGGCTKLSSVFFAGNAPVEANGYMYDNTSSELTSFVRPESTGWKAAGSTELPEKWPARDQWGNGSPRAIREWAIYPDVGWLVKFDLGEGGIRTGGGEREQMVRDGQSAVAPEVSVKANYEFLGWNVAFDCITAPLSVAALYRKDGRLLDGKNYTEKVGDYTWTFSIENGEATIVHLGKNLDGSYYEDGRRAVEPQPQGELEMPATLGGCPVVGIGYQAIYDCDGMTAVMMPGSVKNIGRYAFRDCDSLRDVELGNAVTNIGEYAFGWNCFAEIALPQSLVTIGNYAFQSCHSLMRIDVPASVETIGEGAFWYCSELRNLTVDADNTYYTSDDGALYDKNKETIYFWPRQKEIVIPVGVRDIRSYAFYNNYASPNGAVDLPSTVTNIGQHAFESCYLKGMNLNEGLVSIGDGAFQGNYNLKSIVIPSTVRKIDEYVFRECNQLLSVFFAGNTPEYVGLCVYDGTPHDLATFVRSGSTGWKAPGSAELPEMWPMPDQWGNVGTQRPIREWTTYPDVGWLVRFDLGEGGVRTGGGELEQMVRDGQTAVAPEIEVKDRYEFLRWDLPLNDVRSAMEIRAMYRKDGHLQDGRNYTEQVGDYEWTFSVENGEARIVHYVVYGDGSYYEDGQRAVEPVPRGELEIPATLGGCPVVGLGNHAVYNSAATLLRMPDTVKDIGQYAFASSYNLRDVVLSSSLTNIGNCAFNNSPMTEIAIPATVASIGESAFKYCSQLRCLSVDAANAFYSSDDGVLYDKGKERVLFWPQQKKIEIPDGVRDIGPYAFCGNDGYQQKTKRGSLVLPSTVTNIGECAFENCSLGSVTLNEGLVSICYGAFQSNNELRSIVIPSSVACLEQGVFLWCNNLEAVYFNGNAPAYVNSYLYDGTSAALTTFASACSRGWNGAGSGDLPQSWPLRDEWGGGTPRAIRVWTTYPDIGWMVRFDLGEYGERQGGGELEQMVANGGSAISPQVVCPDGVHRFVAWDRSLDNITEPANINAIYVKQAPSPIGDVSAYVPPDTPWGSEMVVEYEVTEDVSASDLLLTIELLDEYRTWQRVPDEWIRGGLTLEKGKNRVKVSTEWMQSGELIFRLKLRENATDAIIVDDEGDWVLDPENPYKESASWRSPEIGSSALYATVEDADVVTFAWKQRKVKNFYDQWISCYVDGDWRVEGSGISKWEEQSVQLDDYEGTHEISWELIKWNEEDPGCAFVADIRAWRTVTEIPFTVALPEAALELTPSLNEEGKVELSVNDDNARIYYTTNGTVPTADSEVYDGAVDWAVFRTMRIVAIADADTWSNLIVGEQCVRVYLDPELGDVETAAVVRKIGGSYGDLPIPEREECEFLVWTTSASDWWGGWSWIDSESIVPPGDITLFATWDVPPESIIDPQLSFEGIEYEWNDFGRTFNEYGYLDETNFEYVVTNRVWREYLRTECEVESGSSNTFLNARFSGVGTVSFETLSGPMDQLVCLVDGEGLPLDVRMEEGNPYSSSWYSVKVLSPGDHILELVAAVKGKEGGAETYDGTVWYGFDVGGMVWTQAKSRIVVEFDPKGGEIDSPTKSFRTGNAYGSFPVLDERSGFEFLGWYTDPVGGERKDESDFVDFEVTKLYAHWRTDLGTALNCSGHAFGSAGPTGWDGQSGVTHDGVAAAASGWLEWNETNTLSTTFNGKGVLSFWWKAEDAVSIWDSKVADMKVFLDVDGRVMELSGCKNASANAKGWLHFTLSLTNSCAHVIKWVATIDGSKFNEPAPYGFEISSLRELLESYAVIGLTTVSMPGAWVDEVVWSPNSDQTDVVQWGHSSYQARRMLPGKADPMIAWCDQRIAENEEDYDAHVRRAITRLKALSEDPILRTLLGRYGLVFSEELVALTGTLNVDDAPLSNEAVDIVAGKAMPTLEMILADLDVIPEGWDGTVALPASQYPVDEDIYIDFADVVMAKACVHGAEAAILAAQGYDLTLDNQKMCEEVIAGTNRKKIVASDFTGSWDDCRVSKMKGFGDDGTIQLSADGKKLLVRLTMPEIVPEECADAESRMLEIELGREAAEGQPMDDSLHLSLDLSGSPLTVCGTAVNGADWSYYDLSGAGMSMTDDGRCVLLEFDLSATDVPFEGVSGFALEGARLVWGSWAEEEYFGSTYEVLQVVFDIESDGLEYDSALTMESILEAHPQCATAIRDQASLDDAKLETRLALNLYEKFDIAIRSRTSGKMHFFEYDPKYDEQWQAVMKSVQLAKTALDDVVTVKGEDYICFEHFKLTNLNERVTLVPFFSGEILRDLLPPFEGDRPVLSSIPDITFAGTFPDWTMENRMEMLRKIDGVWYDGAFPPVISAPASFDGPYAEVVITDRSPEARIFYTTDSSDPAENGKEYTEPFKVFASCTIRAIAVTEQFGASEETSATVEKVFGVGDAVGSYDAAIACTSDVPWTVDMSVAHDGGEASMRSGAITSSEEWPDRNYSTMSATYTGKGTLVFWWKVSCEDDGSAIGTEYDFLGVYVNGARKYAIDGETDWERVELVFTDEGEHHIEWKYSKDDLDEEDIGDDCGWVDDIVWIPEESAGAISGVTLSTYPAVPFDWIDRHGLGPRYENGGNTFEQAAKMPSPTGKRDANGNVLSVLDEYVAGTDPQDENDTFHAEIEFEDGKAVVKWHPELSPEEAAKRVYRTFGRELLGSGEWVELIDGNTDGFNFFKTSVEWK